jgi:hypothetical protein
VFVGALLTVPDGLSNTFCRRQTIVPVNAGIYHHVMSCNKPTQPKNAGNKSPFLETQTQLSHSFNC